MSDLRETLFAGTLASLEKLRGEARVPVEYLDFRMALYRAQTAACGRLGGVAASLPLGAGMLRCDGAVMADVLVQTASSPGVGATIVEVLRRLAADAARLPAVADAAMFFSGAKCLADFSLETGSEMDTLTFLARACGAPYVFMAARSAAAENFVFPSEKSPCPCCGNAPGLSVLRGEPRRRFLVCALCGRDWEFPRMRCPFCLGDGALETISDTEHPARFIEGCSRCRHYLKVVDARGSGGDVKVFPLAESVALLYLDVIAENEGYARGTVHVALC